MSRIAFVTKIKKETSRLSDHFGLAKWVMVLDLDTHSASFIRNPRLSGHAVVDILRQEGCEEVVFRNIGPGAFRQLKSAGIGGWLAKEDKSAIKLAEDFSHGRLHLALHPTRQSETERHRPGIVQGSMGPV